MLRLSLLVLRWKIRVQDFAERVWGSPKFGLFIILFSSCLYLYWSYRVPSPGKAVAALAVAAAIMTFRGGIGGLESFFG